MILTVNIPKRGQKVTNGDVIKTLFPKMEFWNNAESIEWLNKPFETQDCIQGEYPTKMPDIPEEEKKDVWFDYDMRTNELVLRNKTETKRIPCDNLIRREFYENNTAALLEAFRQQS